MFNIISQRNIHIFIFHKNIMYSNVYRLFLDLSRSLDQNSIFLGPSKIHIYIYFKSEKD